MRGERTRFGVLAAALVGCTFALVLPPWSSASALNSDEGRLASYTNSERSSRGIATLSIKSDLSAIAHGHSQDMAQRGYIYHDSSLPSEVHGWTKLGENVGKGPSASSIHSAFMGSSSHRQHILDPAYTQLGVGAVWAGSGSSRVLYVTEVFARRSGGATVVHVSRSYTRPRVVPRDTTPAPRPAPPARPPLLTVGILLKLVAMDSADVARKGIATQGRPPPR